MSKRKKKTERKITPQPTEKGYTLSIDPALMGRFRGVGRNPLDDELASEDAMLARDLKAMRVEELNMKRRARIAKYKKEIEKLEKEGESMDMGPLPSNTDFLNMAKFMADLTPEEAQRVRSSYTFFKLAEKGGSGGMALMPMLLNYAKTNPGASENQMINYLKLMDNQLVKGLEIAKAMNPKQGDPMNFMVKGMELMKAANPPKKDDSMGFMVKGMELMKAANPPKQDNPMEFLKLMKELVIEGVRNPVLQAIEKSQPTPGVFDQILTNPDLWNRFKEIGLFGGSRGDAATSEFDLKIEQLRSANQLEIKKLELQTQKMNLERDANDKRTDAVLMALTPLSALFAGPINQRMMQFGQQQAAAHNPTSRVPPMGNTVQINCKCGYQGTKTFPGAIPPSFSCPQCGGDLLLGGTPGASGKPEETDTGT